MLLQYCLICGGSFACDKAANNLEAQINVVFLLQNILGVPSSKCVEYLEHFGSPSEWINICPQKCAPTISSALELHKQIAELCAKLGVIKGRLLDGIRRPIKNKKRGQSYGLIEHDLRQIVTEPLKIDENEDLELALPTVEIDIKEEPEEELSSSEAFDSWEIDPELANEQEQENEEIGFCDDWQDQGDNNWDNSDSEFKAEQDPDDSDYDEKPKKRKTGAKPNSSDFSETMVLTPDGKFGCSLCPKIFAILKSFRRHQNLDHNLYFKRGRAKEKIVASSNSADYDYSEAVEERPDGKFGCKLCPKIFDLHKSLRRHQNLVHNLFYKKYLPVEGVTDGKATAAPPKSSETMEQTEDGKFGCRFCPKIFDIRDSLRKHQNSVHGLFFKKAAAENGLKRKYRSGEKLVWSEIVADPNDKTSSTFACVACAKPFQKKYLLRAHFKELHCDKVKKAKKSNPQLPTPRPPPPAQNLEEFEEETGPRECGECSQTFCSDLATRNHNLAFHSEDSNIGNIGNKKVDYLQLVKEVELTPWKCCECLRWFSDEGLRDEHQRSQHDKHLSEQDLQFACDHCESRRYATPSELCLHKEIAHGGSGLEENDAKFPCATCPSRFGDASKLEFHSGHVHGLLVNPKKAKVVGICPICGYASIFINHLITHAAFHRGARPFLCELCSATFTMQRYLEAHQIRFHGDSEPAKNPFGCVPCNRIFSSKIYLQHHIDTVHEKKYKYICDICGAGRSNESSFAQHMLSHAEARAYGCKLCGAKYKNAAALSQHNVVKHRGKKYPCTFCGKEFWTNQDALRHEDAIHKKNPKYSCEACSKTFPVLDYYRSHRKRCHGNKTINDS